MIRFLNGYVLYPVLERLLKRQITSKVKQLRDFEKLSHNVQLEKQKLALYELASFCKENVPYYKELFEKHSFDIEMLKQDINYIQNLPILTKEIVRENSKNILYLGNGHLHARKTGGSTGQSAFFFYDNNGLDWTAAINLYAYEIAGKKPYHTDCHIGADLELGKMSLKDFVKDYIKLLSQNRKRLSISSFTDQELKKLYKRLKWMKPYLLQGHPSSLYAIANYIERKKIKPIRLCNVFEPTGEMLTEKMVKTIEKYTLCKVTNRYGNAEFGVIAHAKEEDTFTKLKVFQSAFFVEECSKNNIVVTGLTNVGFPLLRYDTGDVGTVVHENNGTYIYDIQGRIHDNVKIDNDVFATHYIMDFLDHQVRGIREFQIILDKVNPLPILTIVLEKDDDKERVQSAVLKRWPNGLDVKFIGHEELVCMGWRKKFRHLLDLREVK